MQEEVKPNTLSKIQLFASAEEAYTDYLSKYRSIVDKLFMGQVQTAVTCHRCDQISNSFDAFLDVELEISDAVIEKCLFKHFSA